MGIKKKSAKTFFVEIGDEFVPLDGTPMDALMSALNHFEIPASVTPVPKGEDSKQFLQWKREVMFGQTTMGFLNWSMAGKGNG